MATQALYLRWRPQTFEDVIGQEHITRTIRNALKQERIRHAYLFSGPRGTGKTTTARLLAKAVNCTHPDYERRPCNECPHCVAVMEGRFLDLIEIDAASHTGVDDVRDLRDKIAFAPGEGRYKVYIIDEVHRFSGAAFDALLKTLEEPPSHALFVLATTELDKVPATIKSRCLLFEFRRVAIREVVERLQMICDEDGISVDGAALELIARQGTGSVRDSISLLDQVVADPDQHVTLELAQRMLGAVGSQAVGGVVEAIIRHDTALGLELLNEAIDMGADPRQFGQQIVDYLRQLMLVQVGGVAVVDASDEMRAIYAEQAQRMNRGALLKAIRSFNTAVADLRGGWQPQLPLELALVESTQSAQEVSEAAHAPISQPVHTPAPQPVAPRKSEARPPSAPAPQPVAESPAQAASDTSGQMGLSEIKRGWPNLIRKTKDLRNTLPALLDWCDPYKIEGDLLTLALRNPMLQSKIEDKRNLDPLLQALSAIYGRPLRVKLVLASEGGNPSSRTDSDDDLATWGAQTLGAEITEMD